MKIKFIFPITILVFILVFLSNSCTTLFIPEDTSSVNKSDEIYPSDTNPQVTTGGGQGTEPIEKSKNPAEDLIMVTSPLPDQLIQSPLMIEGEARGSWFFEATFPIKLLDGTGNVIAAHFAQAEDDWMTEDFVPFTSKIEFKKPDTSTGILVLEKDNPSGLPEYDAKIEIPVRFE